jgi:hypothetical protein
MGEDSERAGAMQGAASGETLPAFPLPPRWQLWAFVGFALIATAVYGPALSGPFLSDDIAYLISHPYTKPLSLANVWAILDPSGPAKFYAANYAPVHLIATALELRMFADSMPPYHLVNVWLHALNAVLLACWLRRAGLGTPAVMGGGLFFLLHPANVEAVAWISQLKTQGALAFGLGAILVFQRRPLWGVVLFGLSLLTKASGLFALPTAAAWLLADRDATRRDWLGLAGWLAFAALYAVPQFASFAHLGAVEVPAYEDPWVQLRSVAAIGARYLLMAPTSIGVSAWQDPEPTLSWLDPWWLIALPLGCALAARVFWCLARREREAAFWVAAATAWAPISQIFPFATPVADRYLLFILPGLVGGTALAAQSALARFGGMPRALGLAALVAFAALLVGFGISSHARAGLWQSETRLLLDAARHYPDGATAKILAARSAAQRGDVDAAVAALRDVGARGADRFTALAQDPGLAPIRHTPEFRSFIHESAGRWIELARKRGYSTQPELRFLAIAHQTRGEYAEAVAALEAALAAGGPLEAQVRQELEAARRALAESGG